MTPDNDTICQLNSLALWWKTQLDIDKASVAKIAKLVRDCETIIQLERQAWLSASLQNNTFSQEVNGASDNQLEPEGSTSRESSQNQNPQN